MNRAPGMRLLLYVLFGAIVGIAAATAGPMISLSGTWTLSLSAADLIVPNTAGYNLTPAYSSLVSGSGGPITITTWVGGPWEVSVSKVDTLWPSGVSLTVSISSPTSNPPIELNNSPVTVTTASQVLYRDTGGSVTIYYQLSGVSVVNLTDASYTTSVTYTVASY